MLDVQRGPDVDAGGQQFLDIHVALRMAAAGRVAVGELIDQGERRAAGQQGVEVHLLQRIAAIVDVPAGQHFQPLQQRRGFGPAVRLGDADDDIGALAPARLGAGQHFVGLAHAGGGAEENLQPPAAGVAGGLLQQGVRRGTDVAVRHGPAQCIFSPSSTRLSARTLTRGSPSTPSVRGLDRVLDHRPQRRLRHVARRRDPLDLQQRRCRGDVGVEAARRGGDQIGRDRRAGGFGLQLADILLHPVDQRLGRRCEVGAGGVGRVVGRGDGFRGVVRVGVGGRRGAGVEIARRRQSSGRSAPSRPHARRARSGCHWPGGETPPGRCR